VIAERRRQVDLHHRVGLVRDRRVAPGVVEAGAVVFAADKLAVEEERVGGECERRN